MTEAEWLAATDPTPMLEFINSKPSERKLRLFAVACCHRIVDLVTDRTAQKALEVAERFADDMTAERDRLQFSNGRYFESKSLSNTLMSAVGAVGWAVARPLTVTEADHCQSHAIHARIHDAYVQGMFGYDDADDYMGQSVPYRDKATGEHCGFVRDIFGNPFRPVTVDPSWRTSTAVSIAEGIYTDKAFDRLPILADALQDAGCENTDILNHLRSDGPHVKGCWALDLILGKS